ncbi:MAG TPA: hypothetical protein VHD36_21035 [Pirellulales bacterium]|nr:hypothetical protein [Pirellulales bacterium]
MRALGAANRVLVRLRRYRFTLAGLALILCTLADAVRAAEGAPFPTVTLELGKLTASFRDNSESPQVLSGVDALFSRGARYFDAFDPDTKGASAGLNFEHIIAGHASPNNMFTPRHGKYQLFWVPGSKSVRLVRRAEDDPWKVDSTMTYTLAEPYSIDVDFRCTPRDASLFAPRGYAVFFFADYMNSVPDVALHFRGVDAEDTAEHWITAEAPPGHADYNSGGTYRHRDAAPLEYDADHNFKLNLWSYDNPRFTKPFYYGQAFHNMVFMLMFDRDHTTEDEIRFSLFKFKLPKLSRPAWDWQYVVHHVEAGREYGFRARLVWKQFVNAADCQDDYEHWLKKLGEAHGPSQGE